MVTEAVNLAAECGPLPSGGDLASGEYHGNLIITVIGSLSFTSGIAWAVRVEKPTTTATGRKGKPRSVMLLRANPDENVPDLLRHLAAMWEVGEVVVGESYPAYADENELLRRGLRQIADGDYPFEAGDAETWASEILHDPSRVDWKT